MAPGRVVSFSQLELLLQFLEQHPSLALKRPQGNHEEWRRLWDRAANTLNKANAKSVKTGKGWNRYWIEWKCKVRRKLASVKIGDVSRRHALTPWELRAVKLLTDKHGNLLPNAQQELEINEMSTSEQNINESDPDKELDMKKIDTDTFQHPEKIYITNDIEDTTEINEENNDEDYKKQYRKDYNTTYLNNSIENENNSIEDHNNSTEDNNNSTEDHNNSDEDQYHKTHPVYYVTTEFAGDHSYSTEDHEHSKLEENNRIEDRETKTAVESTREKTVEELKRDMLEFQLKKQKELFEIEKRERFERHKLEMDILRTKRDILVKELKKYGTYFSFFIEWLRLAFIFFGINNTFNGKST